MSIVFTLIKTFEICGIERSRNVTIKLCSVLRQTISNKFLYENVIAAKNCCMFYGAYRFVTCLQVSLLLDLFNSTPSYSVSDTFYSILAYVPRISKLFSSGFTTEICFVFQTLMRSTCCIYLIPHVLIIAQICGEDQRLYSPSSCNCLQSPVTFSQIETVFAASCSQTPTVFVVPTGEMKFHARIK
jgi:hypothetical protein